MAQSSEADLAALGVDIQHRGERLRIAALSTDATAPAPDVIWLHANGFNARTYRHTLAPLAGRLNVLAIDQRGHGGTPQGRSALDKTDALDLRDDLLALLDQLPRGRLVILAGHSLGGCVSLLAAAEAPARVSALALFDPVILPREVAELALNSSAASETTLVAKARNRRAGFASREAAFEAYRQRSIFSTWPEAALKDYIEDGFRDLPDGSVELTCAPEWEAANFGAHAHDIWGAMSRIEAPVRIYRAEHGSTCAIARAEDFPRPAGQVEVLTIPGSTHFLPIERPQMVRDALLSLAASVQGGLSRS